MYDFIINFATELTDLQTNQLFSRNHVLANLPAEQVIKSMEMIHQLRLNSNDNAKNAIILHRPADTIKRQYETLREVGFIKITISQIIYFEVTMSQTVSHCFRQNWLSPHSNIVANIFRVADVPSHIIEEIPYSDSDTLEKVYAAALALYATKRIQIAGSKEFGNKRSLSSIESTVKIVEANLSVTIDKKSNRSLFRLTPDQLNELLDLRYVDFRRMAAKSNSNIRWISQIEKLKYIDELMKQYDIGGYAVANYPGIVLMDFEMLHRQIERISKLSNSTMLFKHPFIMRLVLRLSTFEEHAFVNGLIFDDIFDEIFAE